MTTHTESTKVHCSNFTVLTPNQAKNVNAMLLEQFNFIKQFLGDEPHVIDQMFHQPPYSEDKRLYPTTDTFTDPDTLSTLEGQVYYKVVNLKTQEDVDPTTSDKKPQTFFSRFNWHTSKVSENKKKEIKQTDPVS